MYDFGWLSKTLETVHKPFEKVLRIQGGKQKNKKNTNNKKGPRSPWLEITGIYSRNTDGKFPVSPDIILYKQKIFHCQIKGQKSQ